MKMVKLVVIAIALVLSSTLSYAQTNLRFGVKVGTNISTLKGDIPEEFGGVETKIRPKLGLNFGGFMQYEPHPTFNIRTELLLSTQGVVLSWEDTYQYTTNNQDIAITDKFTQNYKLNYVILPLSFNYKIFNKITVGTGIQVGYLFGAKVKMEYKDGLYPEDNESVEIDLLNDGVYDFGGTKLIVKAAANQVDIGLHFRTAYHINDNISVELKYYKGLTTLDKNSTLGTDYRSWNLSNSVIQISAGYKFIKK